MLDLKDSPVTRWGVNVVILLSIVLALYLGHALFIPLVISLLLAALLWPAVTWLHHAGIPIPWLRILKESPYVRPRIARVVVPWALASFLVVIGLVVCILLIGMAFGVGISKLVIDAGDETRQKQVYHLIRDKIGALSPGPLDEEYFHPEPEKSRVFNSVTSALDPRSSQAFINFMIRVVGFGSNFLWQSILIMFILLFLLMEGQMLSRRVVEIFGTSPMIQAKAVEGLQDVAYQVRAYLIWRTIINVVMAAVLGILYYLLGLKLAWTWMLLTALLWYIPYIGPMIAGVPPIIDAFISSPEPWVPVFILCFYTIFVVIEGYVVVPVVMGRSMEMNATTVMLACLFWELVWGGPGLFLAMPLMAAVKTVCEHVEGGKPWANLMSSHVEETPTLGGDKSRTAETVAMNTARDSGSHS